MEIIKRYILFLLFAACLFTCKKYPEGGFERRGPKNILGTWTLSRYEVNGIGSTNLINYNGSESYKKITFIKHHKRDSEIIIEMEGIGTEKAVFFNKNNNIEFYSPSSLSLNCGSNYCNKDVFTPEGNYKQEWIITKLTKNEFILKMTLVNSYLIKLSK